MKAVSTLLLLVALNIVILPIASADGTLDCDDFATSSEAQEYYEQFVGDPAGLDRDGDGYACDWGPTPDVDFGSGNSDDADSAHAGESSTEGDGIVDSSIGPAFMGLLFIGLPLLLIGRPIVEGILDRRDERRRRDG